MIAQVYDINSKKVFEESAVVNLPSDGVVNDALTIRFPENISQVHFIKLILKDEKGKDAKKEWEKVYQVILGCEDQSAE